MTEQTSNQTSNPMREAIQEAISENPVILFMKGNPDAPACGFSARTVAILQSLGAKFAAVDILPDPRIRQELSELADDPPAVRRRRTGRRMRHRERDVRVWRACADAWPGEPGASCRRVRDRRGAGAADHREPALENERGI